MTTRRLGAVQSTAVVCTQLYVKYSPVFRQSRRKMPIQSQEDGLIEIYK